MKQLTYSTQKRDSPAAKAMPLVVGAVAGLAVLAGAPDRMAGRTFVPKAYAQSASEESASAARLGGAIESLGPEQLAHDVTVLARALAVLHSPSVPTADKSTYDGMVATYGSKEKAIEALNLKLVPAINGLAARIKARADAGAEADGLEDALSDIAARSAKLEGGYIVYVSKNISDSVACILAVLGGAANECGQASSARLSVGSSEVLPAIETLPYSPSPLVLLQSTGNNPYQAVTPPAPTPEIMSTFGLDSQTAQTFLGKVAQAYTYQANHVKDDPTLTGATARQLALDLSGLIQQIPANKDVWTHTAFKAAADAFARGDLYGGLQQLGQDPVFSVLFGSTANIYRISVNQRAVVLAHVAAFARLFPFTDNNERFARYRASHSPNVRDHFELAALSIDVGPYWNWLKLSGSLQQYQFQTSDGRVVFVPVGNGKRLEGDGQELGGTLLMNFGWSTPWKDPMELLWHLSLGYRTWELKDNVPMPDGSTQQVSNGDKGIMLPVWGVQLSFPGYMNHDPRFSLDRMGVTLVGYDNVSASSTFALRLASSAGARYRTTVTPTASYMLGLLRVGADVRPIDVTLQGKNSRWTFGVEGGTQYAAYDASHHSDPASADYNPIDRAGIWTLDGAAYADARLGRSVNIALRLGWLAEVGGASTEMLNSPFGSLNVMWSPRASTRHSPPRTESSSEGAIEGPITEPLAR